jgi:NTE family protein
MDEKKSQLETVLVMQGGGSLGAYECGVCKTLSKHHIKFDVISGTSIGAINAAIIAASRENDVEKSLENFWLDMAETITPSFLPDNIRSFCSSMLVGMWGNPNNFKPISGFSNPYYFSYLFPYLYDSTPLKKTLNKYVDFKKLKNHDSPRLIVTSVDIQKSKSVTFDSKYVNIDADHILASAAYPFYGISWIEKDGRYLWDGSLMSNTPLREVIKASPKNNKKVYMVNLFPRFQKELPKNMFESLHRARDIMGTDKIEHDISMSKISSRYLILLKEMHDIIDESNLEEKLKKRFEKIEPEYHKLAGERGAIIEDIVCIERSEDSHFVLEDADFSLVTIKQLIRQGQEDAERILNGNI